MFKKLREAQKRIEELEAENAELRRVNLEMYFYGADLVERIRMEPPKLHVLKNESQVK